MSKETTIKPMPGYGQLTPEGKVSVNAIILKIFETGKPSMVIEAFQNGMDKASNETINKGTSPDSGGHKSKIRPSDGIKARTDAGQEILNNLRDELAHLAIPKTQGDTSDITRQMNALRGIRDFMAKTVGSGVKDIAGAAHNLISAEQAKTYKDDVTQNKTVIEALTRFAAAHSNAKTAGLEVSACDSLQPYAAAHGVKIDTCKISR